MQIYGIDYAPVVQYGMPDARDGVAAYEAFWNNELIRLDQGYTTPGGAWIPGNYYFYLNYGTIMGYPLTGGARKVPMRPLYRDGDHEMFQHLVNCRRDRTGAIFPKGRRRGYSWEVTHVGLHEFMMYQNVQIGVGSEGDTKKGYVKEFRGKFDIAWAGLPSELRPSLGQENNEFMLRSGYTEKIEGQSLDLGLNSIIHWANFSNPDILRGLSLSICIWEEGGQIKKLKQSYLSTIDAMKEGDLLFGLPIIGGTSNKISSDNLDFQEMCNNPEVYNLSVLPMYADTCYYPMYDSTTGISDKVGARKLHEKNLAIKKGEESVGNMAYWSYKQEYPLEWTDFWLMYGGTKFPLEIINNQIAFISTDKKAKAKVRRGNLEWPKDKDGIEEIGGMPIFVETETGKFIMAHDHLPHLKNAFCGAYDPYFMDDELNGATQSDSKACMMAYLRYISPSIQGEMPAMYWHERPHIKSDAYEEAWKMCVYYDMKILAEAGDDEFLRFFIKNGLIRYLKSRPVAAESPWGQANNRYGIHMKVYQKRLAENLIDANIKRNGGNILFLALLKELAVYGIQNTDIAMTFGICLIHDYDMSKFLVREVDKEEDVNPFDSLPGFTESNGLIRSSYAENSAARNNTDIPFNYGY
jgi:hypothetical protein